MLSDTIRVAGPFAADGVQVDFVFEFKVMSASDIVVYSRVDDIDTPLTYTTDYTVVLNADQDNDPGGTVTTVSALDDMDIVISSDSAFIQPALFTNTGGFYPVVLNASLDRLTILAQELRDVLSRALLVPIGATPPAIPADIDDITDLLGILTVLAEPSGAGLVGYLAATTYPANTIGKALQSTLSLGQQATVEVSAGAAQGDKPGENIIATNDATTGQYSIRFAALTKTGRLAGGVNDIADTLIVRYDDIGLGYVFGRWDVLQSPLNPSSGLTGAPVSPQSFYLVQGESNPQNRYANTAWQPETRGMVTSVGGYQMVPETQDFSSLLGAGVRPGYNISFGYVFGKSPFTCSVNQRHAQFYNGILVNPNTIAPASYFTFATGYKDFPTAIAISAAGSGYTAGDILTFNTGLSAQFNDDTIVRVKTVNGSGAVTAAEIYVSGWYQQGFASPIGVTGGTGTGATFTYTMSVEASEVPAAHTGIAGNWTYGIDAMPPSIANTYTGGAHFTQAMIRAPNADLILVARNAANNADLPILKMTVSDQIELGGKVIVPWANYTPTISADSGAFGSPCTVNSARYQRINNTVVVNISFTVVAVGTAAGGIQITPPIASINIYMGAAANISDTVPLVAVGHLTAGNIRICTIAGTFPGLNGKVYTVTATYEVA